MDTEENFVTKHSKRFWYNYQVNKIVLLPVKGLTCGQLFIKLILCIIIILILTCAFNGHQKSYGLSSSVVIHLNGVGITNNNRRIIWDTVDSVVSRQEEDGLFITTNFIATYNQTQGVCPENPNVKNSICKTDADCEKDRVLYMGNGIMTGKCVQAISNNKTCEIKSWCPLESDTTIKLSTNMIKDVLNYTILIKNIIVFDVDNIQRSNIISDLVSEIPYDCIYNGSDTLLKYCPYFKLSSFIESFNEKNLTELLTHGGIGRITIKWNCNLDLSYKDCKPEYSFSKLFTNLNNFHKGMYIRYADYYEKNMKEYRTLFRVYGLRILVEVRGTGRKFEWITFYKLIGSTLPFLFIVRLLIGFSLGKYEGDIFEHGKSNKTTETTKANGEQEIDPLTGNGNGFTDFHRKITSNETNTNGLRK